MIQVLKRNGTTEDLNLDKIHNVLEWAIQDINDVHISDIEMNAQLSFRDGISTREIHGILTRSAADLISEENPNYQYVAARLLLFELRKQVWGESEPPRLYEHIQKCVESGHYDESIFDFYTETEIHKIGRYIKHDRDKSFTYSGLQQLIDKYLVKNRKTGEVYETPQFAYMLIAMTLFRNYDDRLKYIKKAYDYFSKFKISMSTPVMAGVRTNMKSYTSCNLLNVDDTMDSLLANMEAVGRLISRRAGIGLNLGQIRAIGTEVRGGDVIHTGVIPFLKVYESLVKSCAQGGLRKGSATVNFPFWHYEIEDIIVLKNNGGTDENRVRHMDYCIQFSKLFYDRVREDKDITLFSPHEVPELYNAFGTQEFDEIYEKCERKHLKHKKKIKARKFLEQFTIERLETGRLYIMNIDHANTWSWKDKVEMTNLCCVTGDTKVFARGRYRGSHHYNDFGEVITIKELHEKYLSFQYDMIQVMCEDVERRQTCFRDILATLENGEKKVIEIITESGYKLKCTSDHLIYAQNEYIEAGKLKIGDIIFALPDNSDVVNYQKIEKINEIGTETVYDIQVKEFSNFYANEILVHNCEILHPTVPLTHIDDEEAEIGCCILTGINLLETKIEEFPDVCDVIVRMLDELIDLQEYPIKATERFTKRKRSLGIGVTNLAALLAKNKIKYTDETCLSFIDRLFEHFQYNLLLSSAKLAEEKGACEDFKASKYSNFLFSFENRNNYVDELVDFQLECDWEGLRESIRLHGLRHCTLSCIFPSESSSVIQGATNGIEPPRTLLSYKKSKTGALPQLVPNYSRYKNFYTLAFDVPNSRYSEIGGVITKWIDMAISLNHYYDYDKFNGNIPISELVKDMFYLYKCGNKTLYYTNSKDTDETAGCDSGACSL